jgi:hypothetical protein
MRIICSFYVGHQDYLDFDPKLPEAESRKAITSEVENIVSKNLGPNADEVTPPANPSELNASALLHQTQLHLAGFNVELVTDEESPGLPVLYYLTAHFDVPETHEDEVESLYDEDELGDAVTCKLIAGDHVFKYEGIVELDSE